MHMLHYPLHIGLLDRNMCQMSVPAIAFFYPPPRPHVACQHVTGPLPAKNRFSQTLSVYDEIGKRLVAKEAAEYV
jgi:hypothetical protein